MGLPSFALVLSTNPSSGLASLLAVIDAHVPNPTSTRWPLTSLPPMGTQEVASPYTASAPASPTTTCRPCVQWEASAKTMTGRKKRGAGVGRQAGRPCPMGPTAFSSPQ